MFICIANNTFNIYIYIYVYTHYAYIYIYIYAYTYWGLMAAPRRRPSTGAEA